MITLITGTPGSSKTLFTLAHVKQKEETENKDKPESDRRPVYYHGIKDLTLPWIEFDDPEKWDTLPVGSIIVIDECQSAFRPRGTGVTVPHYIAAFETHRHKGYDVFLITQHPMLVDQNIRRLVGQHFHIVRKFGLQRSTVHEWQSTHEITQRNLLSAVRRQFSFPKELFGVYKSAELHTHKARIPKRVYFMLLTPFLIAGLAWFGWTKARSLSAPSVPVAASSATSAQSVDGRSSRRQVLDTAGYIALYQPRLPSMPWTAPAYDGVTAPVEAPYPVACVQGAQCRCYDQQNNRIAVTEGFCRHFIDNGMFVSWKEKPMEADNELRDRKGQGGSAATHQSARNQYDSVPKGQAG